jgi:flagellar FliL protein
MTTEAAAQTAAAPKKGKGKLMVLVAILMLAAGGGGAYFWMSRMGVAAAPREIPLSERGLVAFEPFMVNLSDGGGNRFFKVNLSLVLEDAAAGEEVVSTPVVVSRLRSDILELLTEQTGTALVTPEGKKSLKDAIRERAKAALDGKEVIDVLFSEFVVQF